MAILYKLLFYPARLYWHFTRPVVHGAGAIIEYDDKLLMVRLTYGNNRIWSFPGGLINRQEPANLAAHRELYEELGIAVKLNKLGTIKAKADDRTVNGTCFYAKLDKKPSLIIDRHEIAEAKWWPKTALPAINEVTEAELKLYNQSRI